MATVQTSYTGQKLKLIAQWEKNTGVAITDLQKALHKALVAGGKIVKKEAQKNLRQKLPAAFKIGKHSHDRLSEGIINKVSRKAHKAKVHIMGKGKSDPNSTTYRLKWFETGTVDRKTQDGKNRGRILPGKFTFFKPAVAASLPRAKATINTVLTQTLQKLNKG